jgi:hypothetical protein
LKSPQSIQNWIDAKLTLPVFFLILTSKAREVVGLKIRCISQKRLPQELENIMNIDQKSGFKIAMISIAFSALLTGNSFGQAHGGGSGGAGGDSGGSGAFQGRVGPVPNSTSNINRGNQRIYNPHDVIIIDPPHPRPRPAAESPGGQDCTTGTRNSYDDPRKQRPCTFRTNRVVN